MGFSPPPPQTLTHPLSPSLSPTPRLAVLLASCDPDSHGTPLWAVAREPECSSWLCWWAEPFSPAPEPYTQTATPSQPHCTYPRYHRCSPGTGGSGLDTQKATPLKDHLETNWSLQQRDSKPFLLKTLGGPFLTLTSNPCSTTTCCVILNKSFPLCASVFLW